MKKPNLKFDQAKIKAFFLQHGEKLIFGALVAVMLYFSYKSVIRETYSKTPENLRQVAQQASSHVSSSQWKQDLAGVEVVDYASEAKKISQAIKPPAQWTTFEQPVFDLKSKRTEPPYYLVKELEVSSGFGAFRIRRQTSSPRVAARDQEPRGNQRPRGKRDSRRDQEDQETSRVAVPSGTKGYRWALIVGLVPLAEEQKAYDEAFAKSVLPQPEKDKPEYLAYQVQRAEVRTDNDAEKLSWTTVGTYSKSRGHSALPEDWDNRGNEIADEHFIEQALVFPLGPLVGREWGSEVTHSELPLPEDANGTNNGAAAAPDHPRRKSDEFDVPFGDPRVPKKPADDANDAHEVKETGPDLLLFRFFDFTVKPGKRYRYRVRLALRNPNFEIPAQYLERSELAEGSFRLTPWSELSQSVLVPRDDGLLVGGAKAPSGRNEGKLEVIFEHFVEDQGTIARHQGELIRGQTANVSFKEVPVSTPDRNDATTLPEVSFDTGYTLVDLAGGDGLPQQRRLKRPAESLFLGPDGRLELRTAKQDRPRYDEALEAIESVKVKKSEESSPGRADKNDPFGHNSSPFDNKNKKSRRRPPRRRGN